MGVEVPDRRAVSCILGRPVLRSFNCHPLRDIREQVPEMVCWPNKFSIGYCYTANAGIMVLTDYILTEMPVQLTQRLQRSLREKVLIDYLIAIGILATGIAAYKIPLSREVHNGDPLSTTVKLSFRNKLEE